MANHALLNNKSHKNIKINTSHSVKLGDNISHTLTFPTEFIQVQQEYPILFSKNSTTGAFQAVVLFGLKPNENLFLKRGKWHANYIPAIIAKGPFLIGFEEREHNGVIERNPMVCIDLDNPRVNEKDGELLFQEDGKNTAYLNKVSNNLLLVNDGIELSKKMFAAFIEHDLLESVTLNIELNNGEKLALNGNYTISQEKLAKLNGKALEKLNSQGFLQMAHMAIASLYNMQKLVDLQNSRI